MARELLPWDTAHHLKSTDDVCLYLEAATDEDPGDGSVIRLAMINIARAERISNLKGRAKTACEGLYDTLSKADNLDLTTFVQLATALGMRLHLSLPPELEERLASEQELPTKQVVSP